MSSDIGHFEEKQRIKKLGDNFRENLEKDRSTNTDDKESTRIERYNNKYDQKVSENEVENFQKEIVKKIEEKAEELGISKEKLIDLAGLDMESLEPEKLKELDLSRGEFDFIRSDVGAAINEFNKENVDEAINEFEKNKKESEELGDESLQDKNPLGASKYEKFAEFVGKHKKVVSVGELALYLSSYGVPALSALVNSDAKMKIEGEKISLKDLAENPELIKEIDQASSAGTPIDILKEYSPQGDFSCFDSNGDTRVFSISDKTNIKDDNEIERTVHLSFKGLMPTSEEIGKLNNDLESIGISLGMTEKVYGENGNCKVIDDKGSKWSDFVRNSEQVAKIIANNLNVPENEVKKYIDNLIMPDTSKISVVELDDFKINKNLEIPEDAFKLNDKWNKICYKHIGINSDFSYWLDASEKEFTEWVQKNGYENVGNSADARKLLIEEKRDYNNLPAVKFEGLISQEEKEVEYKNIDKFRELFLEGLNEDGYNIEELKKIAEENPEEVIKIISKVIGDNVSYDWLEYLDIVLSKPIKELTGKDINYLEKKHSKGIPYITMESGKGVCHDYAITFAVAKHILEEEGVPNLDKFVAISTVSSDKMNHQWNNLATVNSEGKLIVSSLDSCWDDSFLIKPNAVDEKHCYAGLPKELDEAHQKTLEKIRDWNNLVKQEKLKKILTQYDPKLYKRDHKVKRSKETNG